MKKPRLPIFAVITLIFAAFVLGLYLGRNQAGGDVILSVPPEMQTEPPETTLAPEIPEDTVPQVVFPIDINSATTEEFMALPGIGQVLAERIVTYRNENGPFETVNGLMSVEGIGEKRLEDMLSKITIGG